MTQAQRNGGPQWCRMPVGPARCFYPLVMPRPGQTIYVVITTHQIQGVLTHFHQNRTVPCLGDDGTCEGCRAGKAQRWKGYLGCVLMQSRKQCILEVTRGAFEAQPLFHDEDANLRGRGVKCWRKGNSRQAPVFCEMIEAPKELHLPPPLDLEDALTRIWGLQGFGHHQDTE